MQNKDLHRLNVGLNTDDSPENLQPGEYVDALNMRVASSTEQQGVGVMETLQGELEVIISALAPTYYGGPIGGSFIYEGIEAISIGNQIWSQKNYEGSYPGSRVYDNNEANRAVYGGLYTWQMIRNADFCPSGWRIPTIEDWQELITYLGGASVAGGKMKEVGTEFWLSPNLGATNESAFRALGAGRFSAAVFELLRQKSFFWAYDDTDPLTAIFDFLWVGAVEGGNHLMNSLGSDFITVNAPDFATGYIPVTSASTFNMPDGYEADDTDLLWWTALAVKRNVTVAELIGYDFTRTLVKYDNDDPHHIRWIGLLKAGVVLTEEQINTLHETFELSIFWSGVWNDNGFLKANRGFEQSIWVP